MKNDYVKATTEEIKAAALLLEAGLSISNEQNDVVSDRNGYELALSYGDTIPYGDNLKNALNHLLKRNQEYC